jgi:hypothetical protein
LAGELRGIRRAAESLQRGADGLGLSREGLWPGQALGFGERDRRGQVVAGGEGGLRGGARRVLESGAQPADLAGAFFDGLHSKA